MQQGVHANYWLGTKRYPNGYWADFTLTPDGKKAVKLLEGGDIINGGPTARPIRTSPSWWSPWPPAISRRPAPATLRPWETPGSCSTRRQWTFPRCRNLCKG